jgi:hypothetical protein
LAVVSFSLGRIVGSRTWPNATAITFAFAQSGRQVAEVISAAPGALELRRLQTMAEIGVEHNSTIIAMLPVELVHAARKIAGMPDVTEE